jgi:hypothetical protein
VVSLTALSNPERGNADGIETPKYKIAGPAVLAFLVLAVIIAIVGGLSGGGVLGAIITFFEAIIFFAVLPSGVWVLAASRGSERLFRRIITPKPHEKMLKRLHLPTPGPSEYVLTGSPRLPSSLTWRLVQTISIVFLIASDATLLLSSQIGNYPMLEVTYFFGFGFLSLLAGAPFLVMLWVYEDAGVRRYDLEGNTISKVGSWVPQFFVGTGVASSLLKFAESIGGGAAQAAGAVLALFIALIPPCMLVTVYFHDQYQAKYVKRFLSSRTARKLRKTTLALSDQDKHMK